MFSKPILAALQLLVSASAAHAEEFPEADCYSKLTAGFGGDSRAFQLAASELHYNGEFSLVAATESVQLLLKKLECASTKVAVNAGKPKCTLISRRSPWSTVCYLDTDIGYFFVSVDMLDNVNLVFNRWD